MGESVRSRHADAQRYYEEFSLAVGLRDWLVPNARHEQLKLHITDLLEGRRNLRIADIGCGAGVMTAHLRRYGDVTGLDFSGPAIEAARKLAPGVAFISGSLESLPPGEQFDVITLFDVLEHIPHDERSEFLATLRKCLTDEGTLFVSTPFPAATRHRRVNNDDTLQIIDQEIELPQLTAEAALAGLQLLKYEAYDVFSGSPEYQMMVFTTERHPGGRPVLRSPRLDRRMRWTGSRVGQRVRRLVHATRLAARGDLRAARWVLTGDAPQVRS
jgi:2-polyprenyl-3-methyl-5-hydroxy-6-metoxy-1,4-benzoquinol methylase